MRPASASYDEAVTRVESRRFCAKSVKAGSIAVFACGVAQLLLDPSFTNVICTVICVITSIVSLQVALRSNVLRTAPLPAFAVLTYNIATSTGALLAQTLSLRSLTYNLQAPEITFTYIAIYQGFLLLSLQILVSSGYLRGLSRKINAAVFRPLGAMAAPSDFQLWIMGFIGSAVVASSASHYVESVAYGDVGSKSLDSLMFLSFAPFLIPIVPLLVSRVPRPMASGVTLWLTLYFGLILAVAVMANSRGAFAVGLTTLAMALFLAATVGQFRITRRVRNWIIGSFVTVALVLPVLTDISTAMLIARADRGNVSPMEIVGKTYDAFWDKPRLEAYQKFNLALGTDSDYNEDYATSPFIGRFVQTKFFDNTLALERVRSGEFSKQIWDKSLDGIAALLPTPVLQAIGLNVDKSQLGHSMGDLLFDLERGSGLGAFLVGSPIAHGLGLMGPSFLFFTIPLYLVFFVALQSLSSFKNGRIVLSPIIALQLFDIWKAMVGDSLVGTIGFLLRALPQSVLAYIVVFHAARWLAMLLKTSRRSGSFSQ